MERFFDGLRMTGLGRETEAGAGDGANVGVFPFFIAAAGGRKAEGGKGVDCVASEGLEPLGVKAVAVPLQGLKFSEVGACLRSGDGGHGAAVWARVGFAASSYPS